MNFWKLCERHQPIVEPARHGFRAHAVTKLGRPCAWIGAHFTPRRHHRLLAPENEGWLRRSDLVRQPPGGGLAAPGTRGKKLLDDTIRERMKSHHGKPAALL